MQVSAEFIQISDKLIELAKLRQITMENGNVLIAKPQIEKKTSGGLFIPEETAEREAYATGFGRVIALPRNLRPIGDDGQPRDADLRIGDYVLYSHASHYRPLLPAVRLLTGVNDFPDHFVYTITDPEIQLTIPQAILHQGVIKNETSSN